MLDFPEDFFRDEVKCDFTIPEMMKRAWAAEMEILQAFIDICERNNLTYYANAGTLLGAVRHKGFIPWDDDIDISMKRSDYDKLVKLLPAELPEEFSWKGIYAKTPDPTNKTFFTKITTNASTNLADYMKRFHNYPYPASIDIYPLDYIPRDKAAENDLDYIISLILETLDAWDSLTENGTLEERIAQIENLLNTNFRRDEYMRCHMWTVLDALSAMFGPDDGDEMTNFPLTLRGFKMRVKKEWYNERIYLPFECMEISVPRNYHEVLTSEYGDYTVPVKYGSMHGYPCYKESEPALRAALDKLGITEDITTFCRNFGK